MFPIRHSGAAPTSDVLREQLIDTMQTYASIRPPQLKRAMGSYETQAVRMLAE